MAAEAAAAAVPRLHPIRVLVLGADRRFLGVARLLLTRAGYAVEATESTRNLHDLVIRSRTNVVIIDASNSVTTAARTIAALRAEAAHVKVVAVADHPEASPLENLRLLPKWTDWPELVREVEGAYAAAG
jgi:DNA-binding NtrC family response regulator